LSINSESNHSLNRFQLSDRRPAICPGSIKNPYIYAYTIV
jgi:hypothetical protein